MIKELKMFTVVCDNCGKDSNEGTEYSCWADESQAKEMASNADWIEEDDKDYCPECFSYDDDDNLIIKPIKNKTNE
jgi:hypothetical protein